MMNIIRRILIGIVAAGSVAGAQEVIDFSDPRLIIFMVVAFCTGVLNSTDADKIPGIGKNTTQVFLVVLAMSFMLNGCASYQAAKELPKPETYQEKELYAEFIMRQIRVLPMNAAKLQGYRCRQEESHYDTSTCANLRKARKETNAARVQLDLLKDAYAAVGGDLSKCQIEYMGNTFPCANKMDAIMALLIKMQSEAKP